MNFFLKKQMERPALRMPSMDLFNMESVGDRWMETQHALIQWEEEQA